MLITASIKKCNQVFIGNRHQNFGKVLGPKQNHHNLWLLINYSLNLTVSSEKVGVFCCFFVCGWVGFFCCYCCLLFCCCCFCCCFVVGFFPDSMICNVCHDPQDKHWFVTLAWLQVCYPFTQEDVWLPLVGQSPWIRNVSKKVCTPSTSNPPICVC